MRKLYLSLLMIILSLGFFIPLNAAAPNSVLFNYTYDDLALETIVVPDTLGFTDGTRFEYTAAESLDNYAFYHSSDYLSDLAVYYSKTIDDVYFRLGSDGLALELSDFYQLKDYTDKFIDMDSLINSFDGISYNVQDGGQVFFEIYIIGVDSPYYLSSYTDYILLTGDIDFIFNKNYDVYSYMQVINNLENEILGLESDLEDAYQEGQDDMFNNGSALYGYTETDAYDYDQGYDDGYGDGQLVGYEDGQDDMFDNGASTYGYVIANAYDYILGYDEGQDDMFDNGSVAYGYTPDSSYDYDIGYDAGSQVNVNAGTINFMESFENWIVPAIVVVILLGGFMTIAARKRGQD